MALKPIKGWAVARDNELYCVAHSKIDAADLVETYRPGSKHK